MAVKVDLHTHSLKSHDGSIDLAGYKNSTLDVIAITDHNTIDFALMAQKTLGNGRIIVGEEISTKQGDIIGLYLKEAVPRDLEVAEAVSQIKAQGGLVYIPHPFETVRSGISIDTLNSIRKSVDIIEAPNGRSLQPRDQIAIKWAAENNVAVAASSDAHRSKALGKTYTSIAEFPSKDDLIKNLKNGKLVYRRPSLLDLLAPKWNRLRKRLRGL